ncbi:phage tail protein [Photobacterium ganghwense]|uniref:phage tail protein n=1 Tax=Photobacterium ganghwense TaxID=320778 RepID=UPI0039F02C77
MTTTLPESQQQYGSLLTVLGENAEQNGKLQNKQITFTHIAIGDANDTYVQPDRKQTGLVNELTRIPVNSVDVLQPSPDSIPMLKVEAILPDDVNDIVIREFAAVATFNDQDYFHAVGNCARIYVPKPLNNGNVSNPVTLEMIFVITSAEPIVEIDPNVITASRDWVQDTTFIRRGSFVRAIKEAETGAFKDGAVVETLGYYNAYDGGGCRYEVKNRSLSRIPEGPVTYKQFGAKGGAQDDAIQAMIDAHAYANFHNLPVEGDGDSYLIAGAGCIDVKTDTNLAGSELVLSRTGSAPWVKISPSKGKEQRPLSQAIIDVMRPHLKAGATYIPGLGNEHEALQSYVYMATDHVLTERIGYNHFVYAQDSFTLLRDGNMIGQLIADLRQGEITTAVCKPLENSTLTFENFNILLNFEVDDIPEFVIERNQVDIREFSVRRIAKNLVITEGVGRLFTFNRCYKVSVDTADGDSIGYGYHSHGAYGYFISCTNVLDLTLNRLQCNGGWGVTGSNWIKDVQVTNSQINRWDVHFGMGNVTIRDSELYGYGVNVTYGDGQLLLDNVKMYPQYSVGTDGSQVSFMSGWLVGSGASYGQWWRGSIVIRDPEVWLDPQYSETAFRFIYAPSMNGDYTASGVLTLGTQWKVIRAKVRYMSQAPAASKKVDVYGAFVGGVYSRMWRLPGSIEIDGLEADTSHLQTYLHGFVIESGVDLSNVDNIYPSRCQITLKNIQNQMADWSRMSCPDIPDPTDEARWIQRYGLFRSSLKSEFGQTTLENSLIDFDISIERCRGTFYEASYRGALTVSRSVMLIPRVSDKSGGVRRISDSEIWPLPHRSDTVGLVCLRGVWMATNNGIMRSIREGYTEHTLINSSGFSCSSGNLMEKGATYDDDSINMLWLNQSPNDMWEVPSTAVTLQNTIPPSP